MGEGAKGTGWGKGEFFQGVTKDLTSDWTAANHGSRDINSARSDNFYNFLSGVKDSKGNPLSGIGAGLNSQAKAATDAAFGGYRDAVLAQAGLDSESQRKMIEQRLAGEGILGGDSGAARQAIAQAIASPYAQANTQLQGTYAQMYGQNYNNLLGNLANQSEQALVAPQFQTNQGGFQQLLGVGNMIGSIIPG